MNEAELDTEIVVAITVFKAAKREELEKAVEDACIAARYAADDARAVAEVAYDAAFAALADYDEENTHE